MDWSGMQMVQVRRLSTAGWVRPIPMRTGHFPCVNYSHVIYSGAAKSHTTQLHNWYNVSHSVYLGLGMANALYNSNGF